VKGFLVDLAGTAVVKLGDDTRDTRDTHDTHDTSGVSASVRAGVADGGGGPTVLSLDKCASALIVRSVKFYGPKVAAAILNLLKSLVGTEVQNELNSQVCAAGKTALAKTVNPALAKPPLQWLQCTTNASTSGGEPFIACGVALVMGPFANTPFTPPPLAAPSTGSLAAHDVVATVTMSPLDGLLNAGFLTAALDAVVSQSMLPTSIGSLLQLNTSTFKDIAPGMFSKYPAMAMRLEVNVTARPTVTVGAGLANASVPLALRFLVDDPSFGTHEAFVLSSTAVLSVGAVTVTANATTGAQVVTAKVSALQLPLHLERSAVGNVSLLDLGSLVSFALQSIAVPKLNKILKKGVAIPSVGHGVTLNNTVLTLVGGGGDGDALTGDIEVATDLWYSTVNTGAEKKDAAVNDRGRIFHATVVDGLASLASSLGAAGLLSVASPGQLIRHIMRLARTSDESKDVAVMKDTAGRSPARSPALGKRIKIPKTDTTMITTTATPDTTAAAVTTGAIGGSTGGRTAGGRTTGWGGILNIVDFGAIPDSRLAAVPNSFALFYALMNATAGDTVLVPKLTAGGTGGDFHTVALPEEVANLTGVTLQIDGVLRAEFDLRGWPRNTKVHHGAGRYLDFLTFRNCTDLTITSNTTDSLEAGAAAAQPQTGGLIDGQGKDWWNCAVFSGCSGMASSTDRPRLLYITESAGLLLEKIEFLNSPRFNVRLDDIAHAEVRYVYTVVSRGTWGECGVACDE
jgi:hypothetical protein